MSTWGIVVAAGGGRRFGQPKHELALAGTPLWMRARDALLAGGVDGVVVVGPFTGAVSGGLRRRDSVAAGLQGLPEGTEYVLVHDAARALASPELVRRVRERLERGDVSGVVPAVAVGDALKQVDGEKVLASVDRAGLVAVQTPQGFPVELLRRAHAASAEDAADDAELVERIGETVVTVAGEPTNLKITYPGDLLVAKALLQ